MAITIYNSENHTNSKYTSGWAVTEDPFPAFRAFGTNHIGFLPFINGFNFDKPSKIIKTKKGGNLLVNCELDFKQEIYMVHLTGDLEGAIRDVNIEMLNC